MEKKIFTFKEFVNYGLSLKDAHIVDGVPWAFDFFGIPATHHSNECYLLPGSSNIESRNSGGVIKFTPMSKILIIKEGLFGLIQEFECEHHPHDRDQNDDGTPICNNCGKHFLFGQWR